MKALASTAAWAASWRPLRSLAVGERSRVTIAALTEGGRFEPRPTALRRLLFEVGRRTAIAAAFEPARVDLASTDLFMHPFLFWSGVGGFDPVPERDILRLRRYISAGGVLLADSAEENGDDFIAGVRREVRRAFPSLPIQPLAPEHVIYKSFYMLRGATGRVQKSDRLEGVTVDERTAIVLSQNDLGGAWARDSLGNWEHMVVPGGEAQRELAFRLGTNIVMYALCVDYKDDQVHVPFVLKRRKR
jgi:hypothetical protein